MVFAIEWQHGANCTPWPWPTFWRSTIWNVNIFETVRSAKKMHVMTVVDWYLQSKNNIAKIVLCDFELLFESYKMWNVNIYKTVRVSTKKAYNDFCILWYLATEGQHCENWTPYPWPSFRRLQIWNINISETVKCGAKMHGTIFKFWYLPSNSLIAKIVLCPKVTPLQKLYPWHWLWHVNISERQTANSKKWL